MNLLLVLAAAGLLCPASTPLRPVDPASNGLLGDWILVSAECRGKVDPVPRELEGATRVTITERQFVESFHGRKHLWTAYRADPVRTPAWLDLEEQIGRRRAIYRIQGDTLTICENVPGEQRPTSFTTPPTSDWCVTVYRRERPEDPRFLAARSEELEKWRGTWEIVSAESEGEKKSFSGKFSFDGQELSFLTDGEEGFGTLFVDPTTPTKHLSIHVGYFTTPGIYAFDGETVKLCMGGGLGCMPSDRPAAFQTGKGSSAVLLILKKAQPEDAAIRAARAEGLKQLQGRWEFVSLTSDGKREKPFEGELIFEGHTLRCRGDGADEPGSFLIDPTSKPARISLQPGDFFVPGIYKVEGDTLTICSGDKPPTQFVSKPGDGQTVFTYRRKKP